MRCARGSKNDGGGGVTQRVSSQLHLYMHMVEIGVRLEITQRLISAQRERLCHGPDLSTLLYP